VIFFPNCKINLGLRVVQKRNDGYHDLETVFYPLPFHDVLETISSTGSGSFTSSGLNAGSISDNLCVKAYQLLKKDFPDLPPSNIHLHKAIPPGAGLGGGSADGAFTLLLLNQKYRLGLSVSQLKDYALQLGSDCPFFIINKPCFAPGRGEQLEEIPVSLSGWRFVLINPGIHVATATAFAGISPATPSKSVKDILAQPVETWKNELINDFEPGIFRQYPEIGEIKEKLYRLGAAYASMSGSGSTVFGIFSKDSNPQLPFPSSFTIKTLTGQF
jgi:4-diphosphocytidyl-2-C-methyl-D-erythritol kinase